MTTIQLLPVQTRLQVPSCCAAFYFLTPDLSAASGDLCEAPSGMLPSVACARILCACGTICLGMPFPPVVQSIRTCSITAKLGIQVQFTQHRWHALLETCAGLTILLHVAFALSRCSQSVREFAAGVLPYVRALACSPAGYDASALLPLPWAELRNGQLHDQVR